MLSRTRETTVTFRHPFTLSAFDRPQPAGTYRVVIDEEEIPDISVLAFRRAAAMLHTPAVAGSGSVQVFTVNADELAKALDADQLL